MKPAKYMAQSQGLFGLTIGYADTIEKALKKARISKTDKDFGLFTVKGNGIVRIQRNGRVF
jgi:hypothetical protein